MHAARTSTQSTFTSLGLLAHWVMTCADSPPTMRGRARIPPSRGLPLRSSQIITCTAPRRQFAPRWLPTSQARPGRFAGAPRRLAPLSTRAGSLDDKLESSETRVLFVSTEQRAGHSVDSFRPQSHSIMSVRNRWSYGRLVADPMHALNLKSIETRNRSGSRASSPALSLRNLALILRLISHQNGVCDARMAYSWRRFRPGTLPVTCDEAALWFVRRTGQTDDRRPLRSHRRGLRLCGVGVPGAPTVGGLGRVSEAG